MSQDPGSDTAFVAIKKAKDGEEIAKIFNDEADNLEKIRHYTSDHLIKPIAAYDRDEDKCLIFPWAHGGNLGDYWEKHEDEAVDKDGLHWIIGQLAGICSGLEELHESNCRHGDLKPENILWFRDPAGGVRTGTLKIADLGLTTFHEKEAQTKDRRRLYQFTNAPSGTFRYEPPEMDEYRGKDEVRSRQYDIWSMGCILLELLVWLLEGYKELAKFRDLTQVFWVKQPREGGARYLVNSFVVSQMEGIAARLTDHPDRTDLYRDLLNIVQTRLLVVEYSAEYKSCPGKRETAKVLHALIRAIYEKCADYPSYLTPVRLKNGAMTNRIMSGGGSASLLPVPPIIIRRATGDMEPTSTDTSTLSVNQLSNHQEVSTQSWSLVV